MSFPPKNDYLGKCYGTLTVIRMVEPNTGKASRGGLWECKCECGKIVAFRGHRLPTKVSCGCLWKENIRKIMGPKHRKYAQHTINSRYWSHKSSARNRNLAPLSRPEWNKIVFLPCFYCGGIDVKNKAKMPCYRKTYGRSFDANELDRYSIEINGVDRVDPLGPYVLENCVPCCSQCNVMKLDYTSEEFLAKVRQIAQRHPASHSSPVLILK